MKRTVLVSGLFAIALVFAGGVQPVKAATEIIYNSIPSPQPSSSKSVGYQATQTSELGDEITLGGVNRELASVDIMLNSWACQQGNWYSHDCSNPNSENKGYTHPVTVKIYGVDTSGEIPKKGAIIASKTENVLVPWRPASDVSCTSGGYLPECNNGYNFIATFDFSDQGITLPDQVIYGVAFNTETWGAVPIGLDGPYNSLNFSTPDTVPSVGVDNNADAIFWDTDGAKNYTDGGAAGVGIFRQDTGWSTYVPSARLNAIVPNPPVEVTCPADTTKTLLESKSVDSSSLSGVSSDAILQNGESYLVESSGTWTNTGKNIADAEYASVDNWQTHMDGYDIPPYLLGKGEFDLQVDNAFVNWGAYNPAHTYSYLYSGTGSRVNFRVFDGDSTTGSPDSGWYGDNNGSLNVNIYSCTKNTPPPTSATVHIFKYIDGKQATAENAGSVTFPMYTSTYSAGFSLGPDGFAGQGVPYAASTSPMAIGSSYAAEEVLSTNLVGPSCDGLHQYALDGYSVGDTLEQAQSASTTKDIPSFSDLRGDKYIIVRNTLCPPVKTLQVHILKYLDGAKADATSASGYAFPMTATWKTSNLNGGTSTSGNYVLGNGHGGATDLYGADTAVMNAPADYTTSEITDATSKVVSTPDACEPGKYLLAGYKSSETGFDDAIAQTLAPVAPVFIGLTSDRYVIVYNTKCPTTGTISGMKYNDLNRNGQKDANESGLSGWVIRLILDDGTKDGKLVTSTTTAVDGSYSFPNLAPGTYIVRETHQKGWKRMSRNPKEIVLSAGDVVTTVLFGNAAKLKNEKDDTSDDDNRDDLHGKYYGNHGRSNYDQEKDKPDHASAQSNNRDAGKKDGRRG
ncbi:MAG: SdrD B-like domain-containing protein [Candidatus Moraniibacteriota bacterium]